MLKNQNLREGDRALLLFFRLISYVLLVLQRAIVLQRLPRFCCARFNLIKESEELERLCVLILNINS